MGSQRIGRRTVLSAIGGVLVGSHTVGSVGARGRATVIDGQTNITDSGQYVLEDDIEQTESTGWVIRIEADDVRLDGNGHTVRADDVNIENAGIYAVRASNLRIRDITLENFSAAGLRLSSVNKATVSRCESTDSSSGITIGGNEGLSIRQCELHGNSWTGINIPGSDSDTKIVSNTICNNGDMGIRMESTSGHDITGNTIEENDEYGIRIRRSDEYKITGNRFCGHDEAIDFDDESSGKITGNRIC